MQKRDLEGKTVLVTAGGTREHIDPIRFIGNPSSGKMGYALAQVALRQRANVILISGPTQIKPPEGARFIPITSAIDLKKAVDSCYREADIIICAAAVADYRPNKFATNKIKKSEKELTIQLVKNPDILFELGKKKEHRILVGFAAETKNLVANAKAKLMEKNLDMIVANDVTIKGAGFGSDTNIVKIITNEGKVESFPLLSKRRVAAKVLDKIVNIINEKSSREIWKI